MENEEKQLLYRIKRVQLELAKDRGYDTTQEDKNMTSFATFSAYYSGEAAKQNTSFREALTAVYESKILTPASVLGLSNPTLPTVYNQKTSEIKIGTVEELYTKPSKLLVYYGPTNNNQSTGVGILYDKGRNFIEYYNRFEPTQSILVVPTKVGPKVEENLSKLIQPERSYVQIMNNFNLSFNPTRHVFVPRHELLSVAEAREFLQKGHIIMNQLPVIRRDDPIAVYFGALPGRIFRIYRQPLFLETLPEITYRRVANIDMPPTSKSKADAKANADAKK